MSHFSTITHHETPQLRHVSRRGIEIAVAIVALGAALVFVISQNEPTTDQAEAPVAAATGLATEDFLRLNTIDLEYLSPATSDLPGTAPAVTADPFEYANVESYDWLNSVHEARYAVDPDFMKMNVDSYDWLNGTSEATYVVDPHFITMNVESFDWLSETMLKAGANTEWTQQPSGPR